MAKGDFKYTECAKCPYKKLESIPPLAFTDKHFSVPMTKGTYDFIKHLYDHHPNDLHFLYLKSQEYTMIDNSQSKFNFDRYVSKVRRGIEQYEMENNLNGEEQTNTRDGEN